MVANLHHNIMVFANLLFMISCTKLASERQLHFRTRYKISLWALFQYNSQREVNYEYVTVNSAC